MPESEKDSDWVFKVTIQGKTSSYATYYRYKDCELTDAEIDMVI